MARRLLVGTLAGQVPDFNRQMPTGTGTTHGHGLFRVSDPEPAWVGGVFVLKKISWSRPENTSTTTLAVLCEQIESGRTLSKYKRSDICEVLIASTF